MTEWSIESEWPLDPPFEAYPQSDQIPFYSEKPSQPPEQCFQTQAQSAFPPSHAHLGTPTLRSLIGKSNETSDQTTRSPQRFYHEYSFPKGECPREIRNKAEKQRRDKLSQSISDLAAMVPPVVASNRKVDKTGVLRLTAHYLRAHRYVFGDSIGKSAQFSRSATSTLMSLLKGFLITTTYKGIIVVASQNVQDYLGYSEIDLLGQKILSIVHPDDHIMMMEHLMPRSGFMGPNGELLIPDVPDGKKIVSEALASENRRFIVRFKRITQRSLPPKYVTCMVEGNLRKSDGACQHVIRRCCHNIRRARARGSAPCFSGNDVVFIGVVRPISDTFISEKRIESYRMEYRTRHSIDGEIIQVDQRISLVTGYMAHEVSGLNAMNFMHRDDVRWVVVALRDMYDHNCLYGESCYRLMTKTGEFIFMRTRGMLDVDEESRAVRSFVCINTQVEEEEGQKLIATMKQRFMMMIQQDRQRNETEKKDECTVSVEDPKQLEGVILHLVKNLPSPQAGYRANPEHDKSLPLAIIPPKRERIVSAIDKIYGVIKTFQKNSVARMQDNAANSTLEPDSSRTITPPNPNQVILFDDVDSSPPRSKTPPNPSEVVLKDAAARRRAFALQITPPKPNQVFLFDDFDLSPSTSKTPPNPSKVVLKDAAARRRAFALEGIDRLPRELQIRFNPEVEKGDFQSLRTSGHLYDNLTPDTLTGTNLTALPPCSLSPADFGTSYQDNIPEISDTCTASEISPRAGAQSRLAIFTEEYKQQRKIFRELLSKKDEPSTSTMPASLADFCSYEFSFSMLNDESFDASQPKKYSDEDWAMLNKSNTTAVIGAKRSGNINENEEVEAKKNCPTDAETDTAATLREFLRTSVEHASGDDLLKLATDGVVQLAVDSFDKQVLP